MEGWQDIVLAVGSVALAPALLPTVFSNHKPAPQTALMTSAVLAVFAITYGTLGLLLTTIVTVATSLLWFVILVQALRQQKHPDNS